MSHVKIDPVKETLVRVWSDLSRKLLAFLATGLTSTGVIAVLAYLGVHIDTTLATLIVTVLSGAAGYLVKEVAVVDRAELTVVDET
jgi:hypothetical protein